MSTVLQILIIVALACSLFTVTFSKCQPKVSLPHLYKSTITIDIMFAGKLSHNQHYHNYIYNYPVQVLKIKNKQFLLYIHSMEWNDNTDLNKMDYSLRRFGSETALLISLTSTYLSWNKLDMGILLSSSEVRNQIYTSEINIVGGSQNTIVKTYSLPQTTLYPHIVTFITGMNIQCTKTDKTQFQLDLKQRLSSPYEIQFTVSVGSNNKLHSLLVSFIAYKQSQQNLNLKRSGQFIIVNLMGSAYNGLRSDLPSTQYYFFGFSGFKILPQQGQFGISFDIASQYVHQTIVKQPINYLKVRFFGISASPHDICSHCTQTPLVFSSKWQTQCVYQCESDTFQKSYDIGGKGCVKCPSQLNMTLAGDTCDCAVGYIVMEGKCVSFMDMGTIGRTFSLAQSDCVGDNMEKNSFGQCDCKMGYQKKSQGCEKKCGTGFWNGFSCTDCEPGKFGRQQFQQCFSCSQYCDLCASENTCKSCSKGFEIDFQGKCAQRCGDGIKINHECDDGNDKNGDGCSSACKIEKNYQCMGGSSSFPDFCTPYNFDITSISQTVITSSLVLSCEIVPPKLFTSQELEQIISISISEGYNRPSQVFMKQKQINIIKIILFFGNQFPVLDFDIALTFTFSESSQIKKNITTQIYNQRVSHYSITSERGLF